jgi:hypothetical protein
VGRRLKRPWVGASRRRDAGYPLAVGSCYSRPAYAPGLDEDDKRHLESGGGCAQDLKRRARTVWGCDGKRRAGVMLTNLGDREGAGGGGCGRRCGRRSLAMLGAARVVLDCGALGG